jgi:hypothetical protein
MKKILIGMFIAINIFAVDIINLFEQKNNFQPQIEQLSNPFENIKITKVSYSQKPIFRNFKLEAIVNNSVKIDGKWYKVKDKIESFVIHRITNDKVYLKSKETVKILVFRQNKDLYVLAK